MAAPADPAATTIAPATTVVTASADPAHFETIDIFIDSKTLPLAAYQIELATQNPDVSIVGIEGGGPPAFKAAPYYDPRALAHNRIIIAAFSTDEMLPTSIVRIARLHVFNAGSQPAGFKIIKTLAGTVDGSQIAISMSMKLEETR
jgi:hypothetical protein